MDNGLIRVRASVELRLADIDSHTSIFGQAKALVHDQFHRTSHIIGVYDPASERKRLGYISTNVIVWWVAGFMTATMCLKFNAGM